MYIVKFENNLYKVWVYELLIIFKMLIYKLCLLIFQKFIVYVVLDERIFVQGCWGILYNIFDKMCILMYIVSLIK